MEKNNMILIGVMAILLLVAGVQVLQFNALSSSLSGLKGSGVAASVSAPSPAAASGGSGTSAANALANLPSQVGGC